MAVSHLTITPLLHFQPCLQSTHYSTPPARHKDHHTQSQFNTTAAHNLRTSLPPTNHTALHNPSPTQYQLPTTPPPANYDRTTAPHTPLPVPFPYPTCLAFLRSRWLLKTPRTFTTL